MNALQLEDQWSQLKGHKSADFITFKIDDNCKPDLNLGINSKKNRCLLLVLPKEFKINFIGETKENIKTRDTQVQRRHMDSDRNNTPN